jgi:hypothetical protein
MLADKRYEHARRIAVEMLLGRETDLRNRKAVKRALDQADAVPADVRRYHPAYEAFVTCCITAAKVERLNRLLREGLH